MLRYMRDPSGPGRLHGLVPGAVVLKHLKTISIFFAHVIQNIQLFAIYIYTFQRDTQCCSTDCLLMHRCQLYMFRTVTVHPQDFFLDAVCADYVMSCNIEYVMYE